MKSSVFFAASAAILLSACGYKGDLYLPKENDKARFGVIQTGLPGFENIGRKVDAQSGDYEPVPAAASEPIIQLKK